MKKITRTYSNPKQAVLPILIQDYLDICDPVLTFDPVSYTHLDVYKRQNLSGVHQMVSQH